MAEINDIVEVQITRETVVPTGLSFGWANFVSAQADFTPTIKSYSSSAEVAADEDAGADSQAFAALYFGQEAKPTRLYVTKKAAGTYVQALDAAKLVANDWYGVSIASAVDADILAVAAWAETNNKFFLARSANADILDPADTDDIGSQLQDLGYLNTMLFYHHEAATKFVTGAPLGLQFPKKPGSSQFGYRKFAGVLPSTLTSAQRNAAFAKNVNVYSDRSNINVFEQGRMVGGEWADVVIGLAWVKSQLENQIYSALVNNEKVPYTDDGVSLITNIIRSVLRNAVTATILAADPEPYVVAPLVADVSKTDKGNRYLPDVEFFATLAGAIIKTKVVGRVVI